MAHDLKSVRFKVYCTYVNYIVKILIEAFCLLSTELKFFVDTIILQEAYLTVSFLTHFRQSSCSIIS